jgi:hypothetical protein
MDLGRFVAYRRIPPDTFPIVATATAKPWVAEAKVPLLGSRAGQESRRADSNRLPPLQLRVITQALQGCAGSCKHRIFRGVSFLYLAQCCTVLRSRWYQEAGDYASPVSSRSMPTVVTQGSTKPSSQTSILA